MADTSSLKTQKFQKGDAISSMSWSPHDNSWMCADDIGYIYSKGVADDTFKQMVADGELDQVSCLAVNPTKAFLAIGSDDSVQIRSTSSLDLLDNVRRGLLITHVAFEKEGNHM